VAFVYIYIYFFSGQLLEEWQVIKYINQENERQQCNDNDNNYKNSVPLV
jgi:hypothetical protein